MQLLLSLLWPWILHAVKVLLPLKFFRLPNCGSLLLILGSSPNETYLVDWCLDTRQSALTALCAMYVEPILTWVRLLMGCFGWSKKSRKDDRWALTETESYEIWGSMRFFVITLIIGWTLSKSFCEKSFLSRIVEWRMTCPLFVVLF